MEKRSRKLALCLVSITVGTHTASTSVIYNVEVKGDPHEPDVGLFGKVGFLGTPPAEGSADMTFEGTPSVLSSLLLYAVTVKVDASLFDKVLAFVEDLALDGEGGHRYSFTELYNTSDMSLYEEVEVKGKKYLLVHAGIADFDEDLDLDDCMPEDFIGEELDFEREYFEDTTIIVGHVPTRSGKIERGEGSIFIDCGASEGGKLACLCLENGKEFYV